MSEQFSVRILKCTRGLFIHMSLCVSVCVCVCVSVCVSMRHELVYSCWKLKHSISSCNKSPQCLPCSCSHFILWISSKQETFVFWPHWSSSRINEERQVFNRSNRWRRAWRRIMYLWLFDKTDTLKSFCNVDVLTSDRGLSCLESKLSFSLISSLWKFYLFVILSVHWSSAGFVFFNLLNLQPRWEETWSRFICFVFVNSQIMSRHFLLFFKKCLTYKGQRAEGRYWLQQFL